MGVEEIKITGGLCGYETVQKMFREEVTFGVDLARLAD